jgi:hypothetical protein
MSDRQGARKGRGMHDPVAVIAIVAGVVVMTVVAGIDLVLMLNGG